MPADIDTVNIDTSLSEDIALIEERHGPLGFDELYRLAVFEYAQMLRRRKLFDWSGEIRYPGGKKAGDEAVSVDGTAEGENSPAERDHVAAVA